EAPGIGRVWFRAADNSGGFVIRRLESVSVDRGRACLQPNARRFPSLRYRFTDNLRRVHARVFNDATIAIVVTTVDALSREIDQRIRAFDLRDPITERLAIPSHAAPHCLDGLAAEYNNFVTAFVKGASEHRSHLT